MKSCHYFSFCPVCGFLKYKKVFTYRCFRYVRCERCHLIWMNPLIKTESTADDYENIDWDSYYHFLADFRCRQFEKDITLIKKFCSRKGRLLDIGTGTGEFLKVASEHGFIAYGVEPSRRASEQALRFGPVLRSEFEALSFKENFFDVITLWSVLEHVTHPTEFLKKIHNVLKNDGFLALRLPLGSSLINFLCLGAYKLSGQRLAGPLRQFYQLDWQSRHFFLFSEASLSWLLEKTGFRSVWKKREPGFDVSSLKYRLTFKPGNWLLEKILETLAAFILFLARLLKKEDELILVARKI